MGRWRWELPICAVLAALSAIAFAPALESGFVNLDDGDYVAVNPQVQAGLTPSSIQWALTTAHASNWHPLTSWSLQLDRTLQGPDPRGFHLTNAFLHAANAVLLFLILGRMTGTMWRSALVAALFAVHPLRAESVAWISERKDVLSTFFGLLALVVYVGYVRRPGWGRYLLVAVLFALSLMAKPMLVTLPCVMLLLDYWALARRRAGEPAWKSWTLLGAEKLPLFALAAASSAATVWAQRAGGAVATIEELSIAGRLAGAAVAYVKYLVMAFWPTGLCAYYPQPRDGHPAWQVMGAVAILLAISTLAIVNTRRRPYLLVGWLWYLGTLVPVIGLVQVGEQALADRYTYVPMIGIAIMVAWSLAEAAERWPLGRAVTLIASMAGIVVLVCLTREQVCTWRNSEALWNHALSVDPKNYFAHFNLGAIDREAGRNDAAYVHLKEAVATYPDFVPAHFELGELALRLGRPQEAERHLAIVVRKQPGSAVAHNQLGAALARQGKVEDGMTHFREALRLAPNDADAHNNLGMAFAMQGNLAESAREFSEATRLNPGHAQAQNNLGIALEQSGKRSEAIPHLREAVRLQARNIGYHVRLAQALDEDGQADAARAECQEIQRLDPGWLERTKKMAWALATDPDPRRRDGSESLKLAKLVRCAQVDKAIESLDILAAAQAESGQYDQAAATIQKALSRAAELREPADITETLNARLKRYEAKLPFRDGAGEGPVRGAQR